MSDMQPHKNRFYLNRKLIGIVASFIAAASLLVVFTNFSINTIAASRDFTAMMAEWNHYHNRTSIFANRYGRTGRPADYEAFRATEHEKLQMSRTIGEFFQSDPDMERLFSRLSKDGIKPGEISALVFTMNRFRSYPVVQRMEARWKTLQEIDSRQNEIIESIQQVYQSGGKKPEEITMYLTDLNRLNQQWNRTSQELLASVAEASLAVKNMGLWISVSLGIILLLVGVIVSVRGAKSVREWEQVLQDKGVLLGEIHHRVKNNLAVISGLLELENMKSDNADRALRDSRDRIKSMAMIHEVFYQSNSFSEIEIDSYIRKLTRLLCDRYGSSHNEIEISCDFEKVIMNINQAVPLGLLINELLADVIENRNRDAKENQVTIELKETANKINIKISEKGTGLPTRDDYRQSESTGITIIKTLVNQLDGQVTIRNQEGRSFVLRFARSNASGSSNSQL